MSGCVILSDAVNRNSMIEGVRKSGTEKHDGTTDALAKALIDVWERLDLCARTGRSRR
jgi:7-keto-8-aminopelargonate synthetase-like enzyme